LFFITSGNVHEAGPQDFEFLKTLGTGSFANVFLARKKKGSDAGKLYAVKVILKSKQSAANVKNEQKIHEQVMNKPFLAQIRFSFQTKEKYYIGLNFYQGGDLFSFGDNLDEEKVRLLFAEIVVAVEQLHEVN
jgi:serine/threonine protein kinase